MSLTNPNDMSLPADLGRDASGRVVCAEHVADWRIDPNRVGANHPGCESCRAEASDRERTDLRSRLTAVEELARRLEARVTWLTGELSTVRNIATRAARNSDYEVPQL